MTAPGENWVTVDKRVHRGRELQLPALPQAVEQLRHERVEPMSPDPAAGLPEHLGGRRDLRAVAPRAPAAHGRGPRRWRPPQ